MSAFIVLVEDVVGLVPSGPSSSAAPPCPSCPSRTCCPCGAGRGRPDLVCPRLQRHRACCVCLALLSSSCGAGHGRPLVVVVVVLIWSILISWCRSSLSSGCGRGRPHLVRPCLQCRRRCCCHRPSFSSVLLTCIPSVLDPRHLPSLSVPE